MKIVLTELGVCGPGLDGWEQTAAVLRRPDSYEPVPVSAARPALLPANERRRATPVIRLALQAAGEILRRAGPERLAGAAGVFAASVGDSDIVDAICRSLVLPDKPVSPTQFHNSVHNAPAGYWSIGTRSRSPSCSIGAREASFAAGLVEAATMACAENRPALLIVYDSPAPAPLDEHVGVDAPFAVAVLIEPGGRGRRLALGIRPPAGKETAMADMALERLRLANPAARVLPLLAACAAGGAGRVLLPYVEGLQLTVDVEPA